MIDLTPLDVRNKRGDFKRLMRGYDPQEVDVFLELVAERLEALVRENLQLRERTQTLQQQVTSQMGREQAVQDALVTAQELRADIKAQSRREAEHALKEAQTEARRLVAEAEAEARTKLRDTERRIDDANDTLVEFERRRARFLKEFRQLLERELEVVEVEEAREPLEKRSIDLDLGPTEPPPAPTEVAEPASVPEGDTEEVEAEPAAAEAAEWSAGEGLEGEAPFDEYVETDDEGKAPEPAEPETAADAEEVVGGDEPDLSTDDPGVDELAASFEAEAVAEAGSQVVEVTGTSGDDLTGVPRLEEVLAEAGAELAQTGPEEITGAPEGDEIAPPPAHGRSDETYLLYLETEEPDR